METDDLDHVGIGLLAVITDLDAERRDIAGRILEWTKHLTDGVRLDGRQVALKIDDRLDGAVRIEFSERFMDAVGAGLVGLARHHGLVTRL